MNITYSTNEKALEQNNAEIFQKVEEAKQAFILQYNEILQKYEKQKEEIQLEYDNMILKLEEEKHEIILQSNKKINDLENTINLLLSEDELRMQEIEQMTKKYNNLFKKPFKCSNCSFFIEFKNNIIEENYAKNLLNADKVNLKKKINLVNINLKEEYSQSLFKNTCDKATNTSNASEEQIACNQCNKYLNEIDMNHLEISKLNTKIDELIKKENKFKTSQILLEVEQKLEHDKSLIIELPKTNSILIQTDIEGTDSYKSLKQEIFKLIQKFVNLNIQNKFLSDQEVIDQLNLIYDENKNTISKLSKNLETSSYRILELEQINEEKKKKIDNLLKNSEKENELISKYEKEITYLKMRNRSLENSIERYPLDLEELKNFFQNRIDSLCSEHAAEEKTWQDQIKIAISKVEQKSESKLKEKENNLHAEMERKLEEQSSKYSKEINEIVENYQKKLYHVETKSKDEQFSLKKEYEKIIDELNKTFALEKVRLEAEFNLKNKTEISNIERKYERALCLCKDKVKESQHQIKQLKLELTEKSEKYNNLKLQLETLKEEFKFKTDEYEKLMKEHDGLLKDKIQYEKELKEEVVINASLKKENETLFNKCHYLEMKINEFSQDSNNLKSKKKTEQDNGMKITKTIIKETQLNFNEMDNDFILRKPKISSHNNLYEPNEMFQMKSQLSYIEHKSCLLKYEALQKKLIQQEKRYNKLLSKFNSQHKNKYSEKQETRTEVPKSSDIENIVNADYASGCGTSNMVKNLWLEAGLYKKNKEIAKLKEEIEKMKEIAQKKEIEYLKMDFIEKENDKILLKENENQEPRIKGKENSNISYLVSKNDPMLNKISYKNVMGEENTPHSDSKNDLEINAPKKAKQILKELNVAKPSTLNHLDFQIEHRSDSNNTENEPNINSENIYEKWFGVSEKPPECPQQ